MITNYHAKLYANELLRRYPSNSVKRFTTALMDSQVDLNPHQVDAALFAFRSPLSRGAILADEVGLGKTIEAGIVLSQKWAERKRKILIIVPSSLRKQWHQELIEKFYLTSQIIEARTFNKAIKEGKHNPFEIEDIVICSYNFARNKSEFVRNIRWDVVVIDEAHRLRNVYKSGNKVARDLRNALEHSPKLLLTATPLQNSLLELYGLVSFIDQHSFGDLRSFRNQFARLTSINVFNDLKERMKPICKRTLRRQVLEYIRFTERKAFTQEFIPTVQEQMLYDLVSEYLRREELYALPSSQRSLITMVLRKLLASSTFAIAGALDALSMKLERKLREDEELSKQEEDFEEDFEVLNELADEMEIEEDDDSLKPLTEDEREEIRGEINELRSFYEIAIKITNNAKGEALLKALKTGFKMTVTLGGDEKALIFTESRRTQNYLLKHLSENGYGEDIVLFNGSNSDKKSSEIYNEWNIRYEDTDKVTGSRQTNIRTAIVDYFRDNAKIMIATEAAAEGINLQFCSLVVNYDLPWNPQRIEQRIGRCHRYGQKHDVVVVNFLNKNNAADQRVYELLAEKFKLFEGVFGISDEVLGTIGAGVDFEKRIAEIYQTCRTPEEIQASFDTLQEELSVEIDENMRSTRQKLLENFDAEVAEKLNVYKKETKESLSRYEAMLWELTKHMLDGQASFDDSMLSFRLHSSPHSNVPKGVYTLKPREQIGYHFRIQHPLAQNILQRAIEENLTHTELVFDYSNSGKKISILEPLLGHSGILTTIRLTVKSLDEEDYIIIAAVTDNGIELDEDQSRRLFNLPARENEYVEISLDGINILYNRLRKSVINDISERNAVFFEEEIDKLNRWADDMRASLKTKLKDYDVDITDLKKQARTAPNLPEKLEIQKKIRSLDRKRDEAWRNYDEASKEVELKKDSLIDKVESRLNQEIEEENLFTIRWKLV